MKYLKTYETMNDQELKERINKIQYPYYEKDEKGKDTGFSITMNYEEFLILKHDNLIQIEDHADTGGGKLYHIRKKDRQSILDKLEFIRTANKYNL